MVVELISVGTEILLGNIVNTHASYLAEKLALLGLSVFYQVTVGDNEKRLFETVETAINRSDIVILSGGLGPTQDDLTKETVAKVCGLELHENSHTKQRIRDMLSRSQKVITDNNWKQAMVPDGAKVVDNNNGTAPGLIITTSENKHIILLPGPPNELHPMFENDIYPYLAKLQPGVIYSETVKVSGLGESLVETKIADLIDNQDNPTIAPYAKTAEVHLRVTAKAETIQQGKELVKPVVDELHKRFGNTIFTNVENETLEANVVKLLSDRKETVSTAESCTGGLLAGKIVNVPGASSVLNEGYITYANSAKEKLIGVKHETLEKFGAVSYETAYEMAEGTAKAANSDYAIGITGIAGPDGGTLEKPVGLVYIGCYAKGKVKVNKYLFNGNRDKVREYAVVNALTFLRSMIIE